MKNKLRIKKTKIFYKKCSKNNINALTKANDFNRLFPIPINKSHHTAIFRDISQNKNYESLSIRVSKKLEKIEK